jgi:hypothetical protein
MNTPPIKALSICDLSTIAVIGPNLIGTPYES